MACAVIDDSFALAGFWHIIRDASYSSHHFRSRLPDKLLRDEAHTFHGHDILMYAFFAMMELPSPEVSRYFSQWARLSTSMMRRAKASDDAWQLGCFELPFDAAHAAFSHLGFLATPCADKGESVIYGAYILLRFRD